MVIARLTSCLTRTKSDTDPGKMAASTNTRYGKIVWLVHTVLSARLKLTKLNLVNLEY